MKIATKVFNHFEQDNTVFDRILDCSGYQKYFPVEVDQNYEKRETAYIFEDGSALIVNQDNKWKKNLNYGLNVYHQSYEINSKLELRHWS